MIDWFNTVYKHVYIKYKYKQLKYWPFSSFSLRFLNNETGLNSSGRSSVIPSGSIWFSAFEDIWSCDTRWQQRARILISSSPRLYGVFTTFGNQTDSSQYYQYQDTVSRHLHNGSQSRENQWHVYIVKKYSSIIWLAWCTDCTIRTNGIPCCFRYMLISHRFPLVVRLADFIVSVTTQQVYFPLDGMVYPICCELPMSWICRSVQRGCADPHIAPFCLGGDPALSILIKCTLKFQFRK